MVPTYLIETYLARSRASGLPDVVAALEQAAREHATAGSTGADPDGGVRHLRTFYVAGDELAYHLVEAASARAAEELGRAAGIVPERVVEVEAAAPRPAGHEVPRRRGHGPIG